MRKSAVEMPVKSKSRQQDGSFFKVHIRRMKISIFLVSIFFFCHMLEIQSFPYASTQQTTIARGKVFNEKGEPVPYVHISLKRDQSIGTYSSGSGGFELKIADVLYRTDSLLFTCIGYTGVTLPVLEGSDSMAVELKFQTYFLNELIITPDSALHIVKKSIRQLPSNLPTDRSILQGFFREIIRSDETYDRLVEAAVDVFDKGYHKSGNQGLQFKIRELRKSEDYMDLDWKASIMNYLYPKNGLHGQNADALFYHDYIRNHNSFFLEISNAPLNEAFFNFADLRIDSSFVENRDTLLCIGISPKDENGDFLPYGRIFIRSADFKIVQMEYTLRVNQERGFAKSFTVPGKDFASKMLIKYKEYDGKMYLSLLHRISFRQQMNHTKFKESNGKIGVFYDEKLFVANEIISEGKKASSFRKKERQKKDVDLYSEDWEYNEGFWKSYNVVNENPLDPNVEKDLTRKASLGKQFGND